MKDIYLETECRHTQINCRRGGIMGDTKEADKYKELRYGVALEKISTKLRRLALIGAFPHKKEIAEIAKVSLELRNAIQADENASDTIKTDLTIRIDTLIWFMHSLLEETQDLEKIQANVTQEQETIPDYLN